MLRLKQICLVAADLDSVEEDLKAILGLEVAFSDPGLAQFGLRNIMLPIGNSFLEVVTPIQEDTTAGRFLDRRGGDGGYMVIMQCGDIAAEKERAERLGIRIVWEDASEETAGIQLHPKDLPGALVDIRWNPGDQDPAGPWAPAGRSGSTTDPSDSSERPTGAASVWAGSTSRSSTGNSCSRPQRPVDARCRTRPS
jgi:hypothetical protein